MASRSPLADALLPPDLGDVVGQRIRESLPSPWLVLGAYVGGALLFGFAAWYGARLAEGLYDVVRGR